jgi:uncharacterized protein YkvS
MNTLNKYFTFLIAILLLNSCSKDTIEPLPEDNSPVFNVSGQIDGQAISISAGEIGAFMNTSTTLRNNVKQFNGSLENAQTDFSITFSDGMLDIPNFNSNIEDFEAFAIAPYTYGQPLAKYSIENFPNGQYIYNIEWSVDGEAQSGSTLEIYEPGKFNICASITFTDGSQGSSCNEVLVGYQKNVNSVLRHIITQNYNTIAYLDSPNEAINSIDWSINDNVVATSNSQNYKADSLSFDYYRLGAKVTFQNGVERKKEIFVNTQNANNYIGDFSILENQSTLKWDHSATVIVRHNEKEYRAIQNSSNTANIIVNDVVSFSNNSSGDQVSIFKGTLNCSFIDLSTEEIVDGEFEFSFGVAH